MINHSSNIPVLAVTMGDPAGIGPEIAAKVLSNSHINSLCFPLLVGNSIIMKRTIENLSLQAKLNVITELANAKFEPGIINLYEIPSNNPDNIITGQISVEAGDVAFHSVKAAIDLALSGEVDGTVTGPIHKESINLAGHHFSGHTEIYAHFTHTKKYAMLLADENFRVIHVTTHVSLREACDLIKKERIKDVIALLHKSLIELGIKNPRIGVAGLNPHAGDGGLFGKEEIEEILPAIKEANANGIDAQGPIPPDTLFAMANGGKYDGCVAMYHDQGHIPFKLLGFNWDHKNGSMKSVKGVNITLGLPIIRTSVDHGTAFEIAGKGIANPDALINAIEYAVQLCRNK